MLTTSVQKYCNRVCEVESGDLNGTDIRQRRWAADGQWQEKGRGTSHQKDAPSKIKSVEKKSKTPSTVKPSTPKTGRGGTTMQNSEEKITSEKSNGAEKTKHDSEPVGMRGTSELSTPNVEHNLPVEFETGRSMGLREHLRNLREANYKSMNYLDSMTEQLHGLMNEAGERESQPYAFPERINTIVGVARQLQNVMRLKLDTIKTFHLISKDIEESDGKRNT